MRRAAPAESIVRMVSFFEREGRFVRYEARQRTNGQYELTILEPDGSEKMEVFESSAALNVRLAQVERDYRIAGWFGPYGMRA